MLPIPPGGQNLSAASIHQQAIKQGIPLVFRDPDVTLVDSSTPNLPATRSRRITTDIQAGQTVVVPTQPVIIEARDNGLVRT